MHTLQLAKEFRNRGHTVSFLTLESSPDAAGGIRREVIEDIAYYYLPIASSKGGCVADSQQADMILQWMKEQDADVLHMFVYSGIEKCIPAARACGVPVVYTALEFSYFCRRTTLQFENRTPCALNQRGRICENCTLASYSDKQALTAKAVRHLPGFIEFGLHRGLQGVLGNDFFPSWNQRQITREIERRRANISSDFSAIIAPSSLMKEFFVQQGAEASMVHVIPYGTDIKRVRIKPESQEGSTIFGFVGRSDPLKGLHVLIEAVRMLGKEIPLQVEVYSPIKTSTTDYAVELKRHAEEDDRIKIFGPVDREQIADVFSRFHALVMPSIWYENSPIVISESLASGVPVICSDSPGNSDLVQNRVNGLVFSMGDSLSLSKCLSEFVTNRELRSNLKNGIVDPPSTLDISARLVDLYSRLKRDA